MGSICLKNEQTETIEFTSQEQHQQKKVIMPMNDYNDQGVLSLQFNLDHDFELYGDCIPAHIMSDQNEHDFSQKPVEKISSDNKDSCNFNDPRILKKFINGIMQLQFTDVLTRSSLEFYIKLHFCNDEIMELSSDSDSDNDSDIEVTEYQCTKIEVNDFKFDFMEKEVNAWQRPELNQIGEDHDRYSYVHVEQSSHNSPQKDAENSEL